MPPAITATVRQGYSVGVRVDVPTAANLYTGDASFEGTFTGTASNATAVRDSAWSLAGTYALKITPNGAATASRAAVAGDGTSTGSSMAALGMAAGGTYTVSATIRLAAPQAGTLHSDARRIVIVHRATGGALTNLVKSPQAANVAGEARLAITFTVPASGTEDIAVRLFNGSIAATDPVWWDALRVESGTTAGAWAEDYPDGTTMSVYRDDLSGDLVAVRGAVDVDPVASTALVDHEAPLNTAVLYVLQLSNGERYVSNVVEVAAARPVLSHPISGAYLELVRIFHWPDQSYSNARRLLRIPGRRSPVVFAGVEYLPASTPEVHTATAEELRTLRQLVEAGEILQLRASCAGVEDAYISIAERVEARLTKAAADWRRAHRLTVDHVEQPDPYLPGAGDTLDDLAALIPSNLSAVAAAYPGTLLDIAADDLQT